MQTSDGYRSLVDAVYRAFDESFTDTILDPLILIDKCPRYSTFRDAVKYFGRLAPLFGETALQRCKVRRSTFRSSRLVDQWARWHTIRAGHLAKSVMCNYFSTNDRPLRSCGSTNQLLKDRQSL